MSKRFKLTIACAACALLTAGAANAASIVNGGFTNGATPPNGGFTTVGVSSGIIPGWDVTSGNVDWISGYWQSADGDGYSIDLNGNTQGAIAQTINTVAGAHYTLSFDLSGNPDIGSDTRTVLVSTGGASTPFTYTFTTPPNSRSNMNWAAETLNFIATGATTTISFASGNANNCCYGAAIDNVSISGGAVPEPAAWALMIGGFGLAGASLRRRRAVAVVA